MKAAIIDRFGGPDRLRCQEVPEPRLAPDAVLVRVRAAGVNPVDCKIRRGLHLDRYPHFLPAILGADVAGVVEAVGVAVDGFTPGDQVLAHCRKHFVGAGTYAELVSVPANFLAHKPAGMDFETAGALPLTALTADQALREALELQRDEWVLIHAGAGGVGSAAVQIAAHLGARVAATASLRNHKFLRELGAEVVLDYRESWDRIIRRRLGAGVAAVLDSIGGETLQRSSGLLAPDGRVASLVDSDVKRLPGGRFVYVLSDGQRLASLAALADRGDLRVFIQERFSLAEAASAHRLLERGHVQGKLVLTFDAD